MSSATTQEGFNLLDRGWIRCSMLNGEIKTLSLLEVFDQLDQVRRLAGDSPQQDYAVFRLLLAIFWRAQATTDELRDSADDLMGWWADLYEDETANLASPVTDYLESYRHRFDLFDDQAPFMQVADLATKKGEHSSIQRLIPEAELDYFTMRAGAGRDTVTPAEAARWLVAIHAWDYSGIKPGALGDPRVKGGKGYPIGIGWTGWTGGVVIHGAHLGQTLMLNTPATTVLDNTLWDIDRPVWERKPDTSAPRSSEFPEGPCDVLTWQIRRVRLFREQDSVTGVLVTNGDRIEFRNQFADPMTGYRYSTAQSKKGNPVFFAKSHQEERTLWRGVEALLAGEQLQDIPQGGESDKQPVTLKFLQDLQGSEVLEAEQEVQVELVGIIYGSNSAVIANSIHELIPFKLRTLIARDTLPQRTIVLAARRAVQASVHLGQFVGFLAEAAGNNNEFGKEATHRQTARATATGRVLNKLENSYKAWLLTVTPEANADYLLNQWSDTVEELIKKEAKVLADGAGNKALIGRLDPNSEKPRLLSTSTALGRLENSLKKTLERIPDIETQA